MSARPLYSTILVLVAAGLACSKPQSQPKTPLGQPAAATESAGAGAASARDDLSEAARTALDLGNMAYRAGKYTEALKAYREAAKAAPQSASGYYGVYMVAQKIGNRALADSASKQIAARTETAPLLTDSALRTLHTKAGVK